MGRIKFEAQFILGSMKKIGLLITVLLLVLGCKSAALSTNATEGDLSGGTSGTKMVVAFGSCNKYDEENVFWDDILVLAPDVFIWGGDNIYADTEDMAIMQHMYEEQQALPAYAALTKTVPVTGTWDDHDYGSNDGGEEYVKKKESLQLFLDFMKVPKDDPRRSQEGIYSSQFISKPGGGVKIINLDTRYFRTSLTQSKARDMRYQPNSYEEGTILGETQWQWLAEELSNSKADFNLIVTSVQFLSNAHGFEKWANFPHEVDKMKAMILNSKAKGVIFLSGDRHISEFSRMPLEGLTYPLVDFTSSGLTHSYSDFSGEPNPFRVGEVVSTTSFGVVELDLEAGEATFKIMGEQGNVLQELKQAY